MGAPSHPSARRIPEATVVRLPVYQRILAELVRTNVATVSSEQLASLAAVNAAKVRKDLSLLGSFGTRGSGYDPAYLIDQIDRALGVDRNWTIAVVGIGNLGRALTNSEGFASHGFNVTAIFDVDPAVIGEEIKGLRVRHMDEIASLRSSERPAIGVITTPGWAAQEVANLLVAVGVTSLLNFAPGSSPCRPMCTCATSTCPLSSRSWAFTGPAWTSRSSASTATATGYR